MTNHEGILQHVFGGLAAFAQQQLAEHRQRQERLAALRESIEQVVDASEPRVRLVGNYADKLADAVERALHYIDRVLQQLPPALQSRQSNFTSISVANVGSFWTVLNPAKGF